MLPWWFIQTHKTDSIYMNLKSQDIGLHLHSSFTSTKRRGVDLRLLRCVHWVNVNPLDYISILVWIYVLADVLGILPACLHAFAPWIVFLSTSVPVKGYLLIHLGQLLNVWSDVSTPLGAGWLVDWAHDYSAGFYLSGSCLILSGVFVVLVDRLIQRRKAAPSETTDLSSDPDSSV